MSTSTPSLAHLLPTLPSSNNPLDPSSRLLTPTTNPIPLLPDPATKQYARYIHTPLVMSYYYLRSRALIEDPLNTMITDVFMLVLLQSIFVVACVPYVGIWDSGEALQGTKGVISSNTQSTHIGIGGGSTSNASGGSMRKRLGGPGSKQVGTAKGQSSYSEGNLPNPRWGSRIIPLMLSLILTLCVPPVPIATLALTLGAPLYPLNLIPHTFVLSIHASILALLPIFYVHGVSPQSWRDVTAAWLPFDHAGIWGGSVGCFVGGWVGAIPMALDWDRDWQAWPCTVLWGCVLGWAVGRTLTSTFGLGVGKRIDLSEKPSLPPSALGVGTGGAGKSSVLMDGTKTSEKQGGQVESGAVTSNVTPSGTSPSVAASATIKPAGSSKPPASKGKKGS